MPDSGSRAGATLTLHEITGSPNNVKVRIGLGLKGLAYERRPVALAEYPGDRRAVVALSTQPFTPVLVHGETVVFDSRSILRYLEANFRDTPRLFSSDFEEMGRIEEWEHWAVGHVVPPVHQVETQLGAASPDAAVIRAACEQLHRSTARVEQRLAESPYLVRATPSAADLAVAPFVLLGMLTEEEVRRDPVAAFLHRQLHLGDDRERTRAWVRGLVAHDAASRTARPGPHTGAG